MARIVRVALTVLLGLVALLLLATPVSADSGGNVEDFVVESLTADYTLTRADDGTSRMTVVEEIVAVFPETDQNRGIRRVLPTRYNGQPLHPHLVSVVDGDRRERPSETDTEDGVFSIVSRADDYLHGRQVYVITYELENVTWVFPDTGLEFNWDVNGVDWAQPFGTVTARLHLDATLAAQLTGQASCYQGPQGATAACTEISSTTDADGGAVVTARAVDLGRHETLTMAVGFDRGAFTTFDASYFASPASWVQALAGLGVLGGGALALGTRRRRLADAPGRATIIAEYTPPPGLDAAQSAVLVGKSDKAIPAEVLEQAVVGSIRIVEGARRRFGSTPLVAELVDRSRADQNGRLLLAGLFPNGAPGARFEFSEQDSRFAKVAQGIVSGTENSLVTSGLRRRAPKGTRVLPIVVLAVSTALAVLFGVVALVAGVDPLVPILVMALSVPVAITAALLLVRTPLTAAGAEARDHLRGLEEFIEWAEADRIRMLQSPAGAERVAVDVADPRQKLKLYESLLPYAVVFGQEKEWSKQLVVLYAAAGVAGPVWFHGTGAFDASSFSSGIGSLSAAASSSSSTSGGSSGGGSAGGGGGGGGGGGV